jgi:hypothetical protein
MLLPLLTVTGRVATCRWNNQKENNNMIESITTALQVNATTGDGQTLVLPEPRLVTFRVTGNGKVTNGAVVLECCPQAAPIAAGQVSEAGMVWEALTIIAIPVNATTDYFAGFVWGTLRARISTPVTGGTVTVLAIRPEEQKGWSRRPS